MQLNTYEIHALYPQMNIGELNTVRTTHTHTGAVCHLLTSMSERHKKQKNKKYNKLRKKNLSVQLTEKEQHTESSRTSSNIWIT